MVINYENLVSFLNEISSGNVDFDIPHIQDDFFLVIKNRIKYNVIGSIYFQELC